MASSARPGIIPRKTLMGNPDKVSPELSPEGTRLAYIAPVDGVLNVWVGPVADPGAARPVTRDTHRGIRDYFWAFTNRHIIYTQDTHGDENWHIYVTDLETMETKDLTPISGVAARVLAVSHHFPDEILVGLNDRDVRYHDVHRVNIRTGQRTLIQENPEYAGFITDDDYAVRFAVRYTEDGGKEMLVKTPEGFKHYARISMDDTLTTGAVGFDGTGRVMYMIDSRGRNTAALRAVNLDTGDETVLAEDAKSDISGIQRHPTKRHVQAVTSYYTRPEWIVIDPVIAEDIERLKEIAEGDVWILDRTLDDTQWLVAYIPDRGPVHYYHYDVAKKEASFLFSQREELEDVPLVPMHPLVVRSRDGLDLVCYLTLPKDADPDGTGRPAAPLAMVLLVHGGPWARDTWGLNPLHQWLANRGYAVLSVNFRGSTGFGKDFINAGNFQWSRKMHDDLIDAVQWAVSEGIARSEHVAIMGGSYGGYATLVGLTFTPDVVCCGVDIVGPSNLVTLLETVPPYWAPVIQVFKKRVGDHTTDEGRAFLGEMSPLNHVEMIRRPLLIGQGANDPRVKQSESDQIVKAMQEKNIPVTYVLYSDEGHGFARPENRLSFYAVAEAFLAEHLGGRFEPVGEDFEGSTIQVPAGTDGVPELAGALEKVR